MTNYCGSWVFLPFKQRHSWKKKNNITRGYTFCRVFSIVNCFNSVLPIIPQRRRYRQTSYHKQTKNHWARDDPAFLVASAGIVATLAFIYGVIFAKSFGRVVPLVISSVLVDYLALGCGIATACFLVANTIIHRRSPHPHSTAADHSIEWGYAFDVHCNAVFPLLLFLGGNCQPQCTSSAK